MRMPNESQLCLLPPNQKLTYRGFSQNYPNSNGRASACRNHRRDSGAGAIAPASSSLTVWLLEGASAGGRLVPRESGSRLSIFQG